MSTPGTIPLIFRELPVSKIERDPNQPRRDFGTDGDQNRLLLSIQQYGIQQPLVVSEIQHDRYLILDGHRRYLCAQKMSLRLVPCRVYPNLPPGQIESLRYEIQNNRRPWRPLERAEALRSLKDIFRFENNKTLAAHIHMSESSIKASMQLAREKSLFLELMASYGLTASYQIEFLRLKSKLRKLRELEVDDIIKALFAKVQAKIIKSSKEFGIIGGIFLRASLHERDLCTFFTNLEMTVSELHQRTLQSGCSVLVEQIIREIADRRQKGITFSSPEKAALGQLAALLRKIA
jgi:ParB/RepB/Spo0J family partition protein